jgi:hypothetical protein
MQVSRLWLLGGLAQDGKARYCSKLPSLNKFWDAALSVNANVVTRQKANRMFMVASGVGGRD